jgi:hypothetical protein
MDCKLIRDVCFKKEAEWCFGDLADNWGENQDIQKIMIKRGVIIDKHRAVLPKLNKDKNE